MLTVPTRMLDLSVTPYISDPAVLGSTLTCAGPISSEFRCNIAQLGVHFPAAGLTTTVNVVFLPQWQLIGPLDTNFTLSGVNFTSLSFAPNISVVHTLRPPAVP